MVEPYPRVPILIQKALPYDGFDFKGYPERQGFDVARLRKGDFSQHPKDRTASFLQSWLFFGVVHAMFSTGRNPVELSKFIEQDHLGHRVCTRALESLFTGLSSRGQYASEKTYCTVLDEVHGIYHRLWTAQESPLPDEVILSIGLLGCTVDHAVAWFWRERLRKRTWDLDTRAAARMLGAGWCPRDIAVAHERLSELTMFSTSYMKRKTVPFDHSPCTSDTCQLNQIDSETYVSQHRTPECQCAHVAPSQEDIRRILKKGKTPVICITDPGDGAAGAARRLKFEVHEGNTTTRSYIAISHV